MLAPIPFFSFLSDHIKIESGLVQLPFLNTFILNLGNITWIKSNLKLVSQRFSLVNLNGRAGWPACILVAKAGHFKVKHVIGKQLNGHLWQYYSFIPFLVTLFQFVFIFIFFIYLTLLFSFYLISFIIFVFILFRYCLFHFILLFLFYFTHIVISFFFLLVVLTIILIFYLIFFSIACFWMMKYFHRWSFHYVSLMLFWW